MEALVCRSGINFLATPASTSKQPSSKTSRSQSALLSGPHSPHLFRIAVMSPQRIHPKQNERRSLIVFAKGEQDLQQSEAFQAASPWSWIGIGFSAALLVSAAFLPSVTLGPLEFLREGLYRVGSPQLFQSLFYGGVVVHVVEATVAFYLARRADPQNTWLWFWQTFFVDMERSTEIINQTSKALDMKVGNCRYFIKVTTVGTNQSYTVHVGCTDTFMEYSLAADDAEAGKALIVNSDECVDNEKIIIREVDGEFKAEMEPRVKPVPACESPPKKRPCSFWRLWIF